LLYQDEGTFYRQPSQARLWSQMGRSQPKMRYSNRANTQMRVVAYLNAVSGAVHHSDMKSVTAVRLAKNVAQISEWYPQAERIYLVWDNWPVHHHEKVLAALGRQRRVEVLWLPTYAPWLNAIEKTWRWVRQSVAHAHPWCDDFREFRRQVQAQFERLREGSREHLRYVGLST